MSESFDSTGLTEFTTLVHPVSSLRHLNHPNDDRHHDIHATAESGRSLSIPSVLTTTSTASSDSWRSYSKEISTALKLGIHRIDITKVPLTRSPREYYQPLPMLLQNMYCRIHSKRLPPNSITKASLRKNLLSLAEKRYLIDNETVVFVRRRTGRTRPFPTTEAQTRNRAFNKYRGESINPKPPMQLADEAESASSLTSLSGSNPSSASSPSPIQTRKATPYPIHHFQPQSDTELASGFTAQSLDIENTAHDYSAPHPCSPSSQYSFLPTPTSSSPGPCVNESSLRLEYPVYSTPLQRESPDVHSANVPATAAGFVPSNVSSCCDPKSCDSPSSRSSTLTSSSGSPKSPSLSYLPSPISPVAPFRAPIPIRSSSSFTHDAPSGPDLIESTGVHRSSIPSFDVLEYPTNQVRPSQQNPSSCSSCSHHTSLEPEIHAESAPARIKVEPVEDLQMLVLTSVPSEMSSANDSDRCPSEYVAVIDVFDGAQFEPDEYELAYPDD